MSTKGNNGIFTYSLNSPWEKVIHMIYLLSRQGSLSGEEINTDVVFEACKEYKLHKLDTLKTIKYISNRVCNE